MANISNNRAEQGKRGSTARVPLHVWLSYLLIATLLFGGGSLARYTTTASDTVTARAARFEMAAAKVTGQVSDFVLKAGDNTSTGEYTFTVTNNSEVLVKYSVVVKDVPANVTATLNGAAMTGNGTDDLVFSAKELDMGATDTCTLTFQALDGAVSGDQDVSVQVYVEQVD